MKEKRRLLARRPEEPVAKGIQMSWLSGNPEDVYPGETWKTIAGKKINWKGRGEEAKSGKGRNGENG